MTEKRHDAPVGLLTPVEIDEWRGRLHSFISFPKRYDPGKVLHAQADILCDMAASIYAESEKGTNNAAPQGSTDRLTPSGHAEGEYVEARSPVGAAPHPSQPAAEGTPKPMRDDYLADENFQSALIEWHERELAEAKCEAEAMRDGWKDCIEKATASAVSARGSIPQADAQTYQAFWTKYALGSKSLPSCFKCGQAKDRDEWVTTHAELPDIYLCKSCAAPVSPSPEVVAPSVTDSRLRQVGWAQIERHASGAVSVGSVSDERTTNHHWPIYFLETYSQAMGHDMNSDRK